MKTGRIYKIIHNQSNVVYVGSTFNTLRDRWRRHKAHYGAYINDMPNSREISIYPYFKEFGLQNFKIILIKEYDVCDKEHLRMYETLWMIKLKAINKLYAFSIKTLYRKQYYQANKQQILDKKKQYNELNKDRIKEQRKDYYQANKQQMDIKSKERYEANKEKIIARATERFQETFICICGSTVRKAAKARHNKSLKHQACI